MKRLILIEGLCGTGKTTLGRRLCDALTAQGVACRFFDEGAADHPVSLNGHAYVETDAFARLCETYPAHAEWLKSSALPSDGFALVPYTQTPAWPEELHKYLKDHEFSWRKTPIAPMDVFTRALRERWQCFAENLPSSVTIFEGVFFQHPVHDLVRLYQAEDGVIARHLLDTAETLPAHDTLLLYLSHAEIEAQQKWIAQVRDRDHYAAADSIARMAARKRTEMAVIDRLPFDAAVLDCTPSAWDPVLAAMLRKVQEG